MAVAIEKALTKLVNEKCTDTHGEKSVDYDGQYKCSTYMLFVKEKCRQVHVKRCRIKVERVSNAKAVLRQIVRKE